MEGNEVGEKHGAMAVVKGNSIRRQDGSVGAFEVNQRFHVLLVEDDLCTLRIVEGMLRQCNYEVVSAQSATEALRKLEVEPPVDIILTDALMPEVSGIELVRAVSKLEGHNVPIIVMSVDETQEVILRALQAGASDYLIKPLRRNELATLWQHIWRYKQAKLRSSGQTSTSGRDGARADFNGLEGNVWRSLRWGGDGKLENGHTKSNGRSSHHGRAELTLFNGTDISKSSVTRFTPPHNGGVSPQTLSESFHLSKRTNGSSSLGGANQTSCYFPGQEQSTEVPSRADTDRLVVPHATPSSEQVPTSLPPILREIAALGELSSQRGVKSSLQHSQTHSAFTAVPPRTLPTIPAPQPPRSEPGKLPTNAYNVSMGDIAFTQYLQAKMAEANLNRLGTNQRDPAVPAVHNTGQGAAPSGSGAPGGFASCAGPYSNGQFPCGVEALQAQSQMLSAPVLQMLLALQRPQQGTAGLDRTLGSNQARRLAAVAKFREKRKHRSFEKKVRYESRKRLAEQRPRVRGQFVKLEVAATQEKVQEEAAEGKDKEEEAMDGHHSEEG